MEKAQRYQIQATDERAGLEFLVDPPAGRRLYGPGEIVEISKGPVDVAGLLSIGAIRLYIGSELLARPALCPSCREPWVNTAGTEATCYHCGVAWIPQEEPIEVGT